MIGVIKWKDLWVQKNLIKDLQNLKEWKLIHMYQCQKEIDHSYLKTSGIIVTVWKAIRRSVKKLATLNIQTISSKIKSSGN